MELQAVLLVWYVTSVEFTRLSIDNKILLGLLIIKDLRRNNTLNTGIAPSLLIKFKDKVYKPVTNENILGEYKPKICNEVLIKSDYSNRIKHYTGICFD